MAPAPRKPADRLPGRASTPAPTSFVDITTGEDAQTSETLFAIDGVRYDILVPVPAGYTLRAMDKMAEVGETAAMMWLLEEMIGAEGYDALKTNPAVTHVHLARILERLQELTMGEMEALGKS